MERSCPISSELPVERVEVGSESRVIDEHVRIRCDTIQLANFLIIRSKDGPMHVITLVGLMDLPVLGRLNVVRRGERRVSIGSVQLLDEVALLSDLGVNETVQLEGSDGVDCAASVTAIGQRRLKTGSVICADDIQVKLVPSNVRLITTVSVLVEYVGGVAEEARQIRSDVDT